MVLYRSCRKDFTRRIARKHHRGPIKIIIKIIVKITRIGAISERGRARLVRTEARIDRVGGLGKRQSRGLYARENDHELQPSRGCSQTAQIGARENSDPRGGADSCRVDRGMRQLRRAARDHARSLLAGRRGQPVDSGRARTTAVSHCGRDAGDRAGGSEDHSAAGGSRYDLPRLIDLALRLNPSTRQSWQAARSAAASYGIAQAPYYPRASFETDGGYNRLLFQVDPGPAVIKQWSPRRWPS